MDVGLVHEADGAPVALGFATNPADHAVPTAIKLVALTRCASLLVLPLQGHRHHQPGSRRRRTRGCGTCSGRYLSSSTVRNPRRGQRESCSAISGSATAAATTRARQLTARGRAKVEAAAAAGTPPLLLVLGRLLGRAATFLFGSRRWVGAWIDPALLRGGQEECQIGSPDGFWQEW